MNAVFCCKILKCSLVFFIVLCSNLLIGQSVKKSNVEQPPTQQEMQALIRQAQKQMSNMSAKEKKTMDSLGILLPDFNKTAQQVSHVNDKQLSKAYAKETQIVPVRNTGRISRIPPTPVTQQGVITLLKYGQQKIQQVMGASIVTLGDEIFQQLMSLPAAQAGRAAVGIWMMGNQAVAVYVMGKIVLQNPNNIDNLSNYTSMLIMSSAEPLAIPILQYLNKQYPNNNAILNNLGQAWYGLGEMNKAEKYLDSAIRLYAYHPQANLTKSYIEESKGNKNGAINAVKQSLHHAYTNEKEGRLRKFGVTISEKDIEWKLPGNDENLILSEYHQPAYPKSVDECIALEKVWDDYRAMCDEEIEKLKQTLKGLQELAQQKNSTRINQNIQFVNKALLTGKTTGTLTVMPFYAPKATLKLKALNDESSNYMVQLKRLNEKQMKFLYEKNELKKTYDSMLHNINEKEAEQTGEGFANKSFCGEKKMLTNNYLQTVNTEAEELKQQMLDLFRRKLNEEVHWLKYTQWPEEFEVSKVIMKIKWWEALREAHFEKNTLYRCAEESKNKPSSKFKLAEFDDVACQYHTELNMIVMKASFDCSRVTTSIDVPFIKGSLKQNMDKETFADQFMNCTVEITAEAGKEIEVGPIQVGATIGGGVGIEIDRTGLKDAYVIGKAGASVGSADVGVEGRISLVSGSSSMGGTGLLESLN